MARGSWLWGKQGGGDSGGRHRNLGLTQGSGSGEGEKWMDSKDVRAFLKRYRMTAFFLG